jgi:hypothetical protein
MNNEKTRTAVVRRGEFTPLPGVHARVRAIPCPGWELPGADPWRGGYRRAGRFATGRAGPSDPEPWIESLRSSPAGIILVGPSPEVDREPSAARAAIAALRVLGRGAVLIDVPFSGEFPEAGSDLVFVHVWRFGEEAALWGRLRTLAPHFRAGVALPVIPGWTGEGDFLAAFLSRARDEGARFAVPLDIADSGVSRAAIHADFATAFPGGADSYFDLLHHGDWDALLAPARAQFPSMAQRLGLSPRVPRPVGRADFALNSRLIEELESRAETSGEALAARLRGAARRVEDFGRDLSGLVAEGNLRLLFSAGTPERAVLDRLFEPSGTVPA